MNLNFRGLRVDEVEVRIQSVKPTGAILVLYKDARCDMNLLDETVGPLNWQRKHDRENANCTVSIWDPDRQQWVNKEDVGTESYQDAEKGLASDSFKRACINWGIGRELYTAPFIFVAGAGKKDSFWVSELTVENHQIQSLKINACGKYGERTDVVAFSWSRAKGKAKVAKFVSQAEPDPAPRPADAPEPKTEKERAMAAYPTREDMMAYVKNHYVGLKAAKLFETFRVVSFEDLPDEALMVAYNSAVKAKTK